MALFCLRGCHAISLGLCKARCVLGPSGKSYGSLEASRSLQLHVQSTGSVYLYTFICMYTRTYRSTCLYTQGLSLVNACTHAVCMEAVSVFIHTEVTIHSYIRAYLPTRVHTYLPTVPTYLHACMHTNIYTHARIWYTYVCDDGSATLKAQIKLWWALSWTGASTAHRTLYLILQPGARIKVHSDSF